MLLTSTVVSNNNGLFYPGDEIVADLANKNDTKYIYVSTGLRYDFRALDNIATKLNYTDVASEQKVNCYQIIILRAANALKTNSEHIR